VAGWFLLTADAVGLTTVTTTYTVGDQLGTGWTFTNAGIAAGGSGMIHSAVFIDDSDVMGAAILHLYDTLPSGLSDNAAYAPSDADAGKKVGEIWFPPARDLGGVRDSYVQCQAPYILAGGATSLFGVMETRSANAVFAGGATSLHVRMNVWRDS
jgi:hypothetical protein